MIDTHPFKTACKSVLPLWSPAAQVRPSAPDVRASELFVFLHGMLFTNIQRDDFSLTLARLEPSQSRSGRQGVTRSLSLCQEVREFVLKPQIFC
jgi:hypothetical protein